MEIATPKITTMKIILPLSTPKRSTAGKVISRVMIPKQRLASRVGTLGALPETIPAAACTARQNTPDAAMQSQPSTYLLSTISRLE